LILLVDAKDAKDAKQVADLARAAEVYARRQKLSDEHIVYATMIKVDAMTLMGEFLQASNPKGAESSKRELSGTGRFSALSPSAPLMDHRKMWLLIGIYYIKGGKMVKPLSGKSWRGGNRSP